MEESNKSELKAELIYGLNDRPPLRETLFAALQHLLAIFVAIITPPLIIAGALKLDIETTSFLVSMALFASGVSTFIQCRRIGGIGTGLLCIQGTSFSFIGPIISAGLTGGLPVIFGACMAASTVEMLISRLLKYTRKIITPLVSGIVVTLIGMSLIKVGITACGGGAVAKSNGTFGSFEHVGFGFVADYFLQQKFEPLPAYEFDCHRTGHRLRGGLVYGFGGLFFGAELWRVQYTCSF